MTPIENRKKLVSFRVTDKEYEALKRLCMSKGLRSISDLTRAALLKPLSSTFNSNEAVYGDLLSLIEALERLDEAITNLQGRLCDVVGPNAKRQGTAATLPDLDWRS